MTDMVVLVRWSSPVHSWRMSLDNRADRRVAGRMLARSMNASPHKLTRWGLNRVEIEPGFTMLDVGCGGGRTIAWLHGARRSGIRRRLFVVECGGRTRTESRLDRAWSRRHQRGRRLFLAVRRSHLRARYRGRNALLLARSARRRARSDARPEAWPALLIIAETYRGRRNDWLHRPVTRLVLRAAYLTPEQHGRLLSDAGYRDVEVFTEKAHRWICAIGRTQSPRESLI
jgi:hypothetical protein